MRIGKVVGRVCLTQTYETLVGGRSHIVEGQDRYSRAGGKRRTAETLVAYDHLGAGDGDLVGVSESREASAPFYPEKRVPVDAYCSAILDAAVVSFDV